MATIRKPIFIVPVDLGSVTAASARAGFPVTNINRFKSAGLTWKSGTVSGGQRWARGQFASAQQIDFCAIVGANPQFTTMYRLRLGYSQTDVDGSEAPYDSGTIPFIPSFDEDVGSASLSMDFIGKQYLLETPPSPFHSHLELAVAQGCTWWRIDVTGQTVDFQCSALVLGKKVEPSHFYNLDFEYGVKDLGSLDFSRWGVWDEEDGKVLRTVSFTLGWQSEAEYEASFRPMIERLGKRGVVYVVFDPTVSPYRATRTYMGVFDKPPGAKGLRKPRTFSQDYEITSMI